MTQAVPQSTLWHQCQAENTVLRPEVGPGGEEGSGSVLSEREQGVSAACWLSSSTRHLPL